MFCVGEVLVRIATPDDRAALKNFCRDNPDYDVLLTGEVPDPEAWVEDFLHDLPPASFNWSATHKLIAVSAHEPHAIQAIMDVSEDMIAQGVGHIGLFQVAQALHATGYAHHLYEGLEAWLMKRGTDVLRLGVLDGNPRGLAFWTRHGYRQTRTRIGTAPTGKSHLT